MTREEVIKHLSNDLFVSAKGQLCVDVRKKDEFMDAIGISIDALRTVSREQVEKLRGEWISLEPEIGLFECSMCDHMILKVKCNFCPFCGAPMTDEAVQMVMRRLEALHGETETD